VEVLIVIIVRNSGRGTNEIFFLSLLDLHTFKVVNSVQINIIHIVLEVTVVFNSFVETSEVRVQVRTETCTRSHGLETELQTIVDLVVFVLCHAFVETCFAVSASHTLGNTVLVDAPQVGNAIFLVSA